MSMEGRYDSGRWTEMSKERKVNWSDAMDSGSLCGACLFCFSFVGKEACRGKGDFPVRMWKLLKICSDRRKDRRAFSLSFIYTSVFAVYVSCESDWVLFFPTPLLKSRVCQSEFSPA
jgi:hypothetical protein